MHPPISTAIVIATLLVSGVEARAAAAVDPRGERFARLVAEVSDGMREHGVPGAAVGVLARGRVFTEGLGVTSVEHPLPVTAETLFQIGSITKTFTGALLVRLSEQGKIELDAPIRRYLPGFRVADAEVSRSAKVRDLLTHSGGWVGDHFLDTGPGDDALTRYVESMATLEQLAPLGRVWSYNNAGFYVAGRLIEVLTGKTFERALRDELLTQLGLERTLFDPGEVMTHRFAVGHDPTLDGPRVLRPWNLPRNAAPAGGIAGSIDDLLRWAEFQLGDGTSPSAARILTSHGLAAMHAPLSAKQGTDERIGLVWNIREIGGVREIYHGGTTFGQTAWISLVPERDFALAILANSTSGHALIRDVRRAAFEAFLDLAIEDPKPLETTQADLEAYIGHYSRPFADIELALEDGRLVARVTPKQRFPYKDSPLPPAGPPVPLALYADDRFLETGGSRQGERAEFIRRPDGSIGWLRFRGRIHRRVP